ncbi:S8 family serine peptidase [Kordia sp.]|uniref:S8 family serine peptidase n=1 Tax=Kordia sp. TaxID=1965332 RepID=UPI003D2BD691
MKLLKLVTLFSICSCIISCASVKSPKAVTFAISKKQPLTEKEKKDWYFKDIYTDSIPGISLHKTYDFLNNKKAATIIVAVIDSEIDINHEDLKNQIWVNKDEIPNNNIDDDNNGYVDDIYGWNFLGTTVNDSLSSTTHETVRIVRKYKDFFHDKDSLAVREKNKILYQNYSNASVELETRLLEAIENYDYFVGFTSRYEKLKDTLSSVLKSNQITLQKLDSLKEVSNDSTILKKIKSMQYCMQNDIDEDWLKDVTFMHKINKDKVYNINYYKDRLTKDDPLNLKDSIYGNNNIEGTYKLDHATEVASLILSVFDDRIKHNIKIMPVVISTYGSEYDKDIALAIRYAVDNGAKVINMSIGKAFTLNEEWIIKSIQYAESKDVLIVSAAGNEALDLDNPDIYYYPNDMDQNKNEITNNFIVIGSSNQTNNLVSVYSNYGEKTVDIFAPGEEIKVLTRDESINDSGTSLSTAIVSNIAALIRSRYPKLSASEVKQIIMESGVSYDIMVNKPSLEGKEEKVPFSSLSKSGKIVNAYNALLMAEEVSKKKKKRKK